MRGSGKTHLPIGVKKLGQLLHKIVMINDDEISSTNCYMIIGCDDVHDDMKRHLPVGVKKPDQLLHKII